MKYLVQGICMAVSILFLSGCGLSDKRPDYVGDISPYAEMESSDNLQVFMEDSVVYVDAEKIVFYVRNLGDIETGYDGNWKLEVLYEDAWHTIPLKSDLLEDDPGFYFAGCGKISRPHTTNEHTFFMTLYSYQFKSGTYRLVQPYIVNENKIMSLEFQMEE